MNMLKKLLAMLGNIGSRKGASRKIKPRGKVGKRRYKGGRFARRMHRQWARVDKTYVPGQNGLSAVSEANRNDHGVIMSRRERKQVAKRTGREMRRYYNGPTYFRTEKKGVKRA